MSSSEIDELRRENAELRRRLAVTERKTLDAERADFFALSLDLMCIGVTAGWFLQLNQAWERALGWSIEELRSRPFIEFVHPEDREATLRQMAALEASRTIVHFENRYRCKDGSYRWLQWNALASGQLIYACARDVTEERARAPRDRLLFLESPVAMWLVEPETLRFLDANEAALKSYGYTRDELLSLTVFDIIAEEHRADIRAAAALAFERENVFLADLVHRTKSGEARIVSATSHRIEFEGKPAILTMLVDVTDAKRVEEERRRQIERLRLLDLCCARINDVIMITEAAPLSEPGPRIVYVNDAFTRVTGYTLDEALGRTPRFLQGPETDRGALDVLRTALERGEGARVDVVNYTKSGTKFWVELDVVPVRNDDGALTHFVAVERDTTDERRKAEALRDSEIQLRQAQKMEAVGQLAGGVAHDFNNLLSVVISYIELMLADLRPEDALREDLEHVHNAGLRAADLTRQLLAFSRRQVLQPTVVVINDIVGALEKMLRRTIGAHIGLRLQLEPQLGNVFADKGQIEQVIINLVVNARDAMPTGGTLTIETFNTSVAPSDDATDDRSWIGVRVSDTGIGMDEATRQRIFEPFFTTKEKGKGTGLGLSIVHGIVQQSGGHIVVDSAVGQGTSFTIFLPRTDRAEEVPASEPSAGAPLHGGDERATVLLVEDDPAVRRLVREILRKARFEVMEAANAGEALLIFERYGDEITLLLTDVVMPLMSGVDLAKRLRTSRPDMKVLFMSGYVDDAAASESIDVFQGQFVAKPVQAERLVSKVREVLAASSDSSRP